MMPNSRDFSFSLFFIFCWLVYAGGSTTEELKKLWRPAGWRSPMLTTAEFKAEQTSPASSTLSFAFRKEFGTRLTSEFEAL